MAKHAKQKRETPRRPKVETCMVCGKKLQPHERPQDPRDPGLCGEHQQALQQR